jgi:hypothetical protein
MAVAVLLAGCGSGERAPIEPSASQDGARVDVVVGQPFTLKIGQTAAVAGTDLTIGFIGVPADSRCPTDVQCVWAGNARVALRAAGGNVDLNTHEQPRASQLGRYQLELTALSPDPKSTESIAPSTYAATLLLTDPGV